MIRNLIWPVLAFVIAGAFWYYHNDGHLFRSDPPAVTRVVLHGNTGTVWTCVHEHGTYRCVLPQDALKQQATGKP